MSGYFTPGTRDAPLGAASIPPHLTLSPPPRRSRATVAALTAAALFTVAGIGWLLLPKDPDPVALRLRLAEGDSLLYRVETSTAAVAELRGGIGRQLFTKMEGMLKLEVTRVRSASVDAHSELTVFSFTGNGSDMSGPKRFRQPLRLSPKGPVLDGVFMARGGWPLLYLPALTPLLPQRPLKPGEQRSVRDVLFFSKKEPRMDGTTRFVGFQEVEGTRMAVVEGMFTGRDERRDSRVRGDWRVEIRARLDPASGRLHDASGKVDFDGVVEDPRRATFTSTETFRLMPV